MRLILAGSFTFMIGLIVTPLVRRMAQNINAVAIPRSDRWHLKPVPLLGGIAIYVTFLIGCLFFISNHLSVSVILAAGTLLFCVGLVDDFVKIKPHTKLTFQLIAASIVVFFDFHLPWTEYASINDFITILWLVGITNAVNLLDNMDGLACGVGLIACFFLTCTFLLNGQMHEAVLSVLMGGTLLSFLMFNSYPASIFMGDSGSMLIGFTLGSMALLNSYERSRNLTLVLLIPVLILFIPIFDTTIVSITRRLAGKSIFQGGLDHTSHRLTALGMSERRAVLVLYLCAFLSGLLALVVRLVQIEVVPAYVIGFAFIVIFAAFCISKMNVIYRDYEKSPKTQQVNQSIFFHQKK